jgi:hypothetical protein
MIPGLPILPKVAVFEAELPGERLVSLRSTATLRCPAVAIALRRAVAEALSERQRRVFVTIVVNGVPLHALAVEMGSTRNAF